MHHHLEVILPPTKDVKAALDKILEPWSEFHKDVDGESNHHGFWDWWVIGGRWSGAKIQAQFPQSAFDAFEKELSEKGVTVSGVQWGKQELSPSSQIPMVDELWRKHFPGGGDTCPIFNHYVGTKGYPDVCQLKDLPPALKASRVMIVSNDPSDDGQGRVTFMIQDSFWNGVDHVDAKWDGNVMDAVEMARGRFKTYKPDYAKLVIPTDEWLCATVDYHS